jgi:hypothetical protein
MPSEGLTLQVGVPWKATRKCLLTVTAGSVGLRKAANGEESWVEPNNPIILYEGDQILCSETSKFTYTPIA